MIHVALYGTTAKRGIWLARALQRPTRRFPDFARYRLYLVTRDIWVRELSECVEGFGRNPRPNYRSHGNKQPIPPESHIIGIIMAQKAKAPLDGAFVIYGTDPV